jgi:putative ABC transport system permease protein
LPRTLVRLKQYGANEFTILKTSIMFKTYFKIAWRNLRKDKQFTLLNILGLSAGLACTLLIFLWVNDELSYDKFFVNNDQIYQLMEHQNNVGNIGVSDGSSGLLSDAVKQHLLLTF